MRDEVVVASTVGTISAPSAPGDLKNYSFTIGSMHFWNNQVPALCASGITGVEAVNLWKMTAGTWVQVYDGSGTAIQLTATKPQEALLTPGVYGVSKTSGTGIVVTIQMP